MCFLPPNCIFCAHYNHDDSDSDWDCLAFKEIPEDILFGGNSHTKAYPGDGGVLFTLNSEHASDYAKIKDLRASMLEEQPISQVSESSIGL